MPGMLPLRLKHHSAHCAHLQVLASKQQRVDPVKIQGSHRSSPTHTTNHAPAELPAPPRALRSLWVQQRGWKLQQGEGQTWGHTQARQAWILPQQLVLLQLLPKVRHWRAQLQPAGAAGEPRGCRAGQVEGSVAAAAAAAALPGWPARPARLRSGTAAKGAEEVMGADV
eukprot:1161773-Pelagomonas_calceolata.AAC.10